MPTTNKKSVPTSPAAASTTSAKKAVPSTPAKTASKAAPKTTTKAVAKVPVRTTAAAKPAAAPTVKVKKPKMVRDSFSIPKAEYEVLGTLKLRAAKLGKPVKKTELLRAGIKVLAALSDAALLTALTSVPSLKTGRPAKGKSAK